MPNIPHNSINLKINLLWRSSQDMVSYTVQVNTIHRKFTGALKKAKTRQAINKVYSAHRKDHERLLKEHLAEEMRQIKKAKAQLD